MFDLNHIEYNYFTLLEPKNRAGKMVMLTKEKVDKLIRFKESNDIVDDDFQIYLNEIGLFQDEINRMLEYYHINYSNLIEDWKIEKEVKKIIQNLKIKKQDSREIIEEDEFSEDQIALYMSDYNSLSKEEKLETLWLLWEKTDDKKKKNDYELKMLSLAEEIIKGLKKVTKIKVIIEALYNWLSNSYWESEILFSKEIVKSIREKVNSNTEALSYLLDSFNSASNKITQAIFKKAMVLTSIWIIEKTEGLIFEFALEKLKNWISNSEWEAEKLFIQEIVYRENLNSLKNMVE